MIPVFPEMFDQFARIGISSVWTTHDQSSLPIDWTPAAGLTIDDC